MFHFVRRNFRLITYPVLYCFLVASILPLGACGGGGDSAGGEVTTVEVTAGDNGGNVATELVPNKVSEVQPHSLMQEDVIAQIGALGIDYTGSPDRPNNSYASITDAGIDTIIALDELGFSESFGDFWGRLSTDYPIAYTAQEFCDLINTAYWTTEGNPLSEMLHKGVDDFTPTSAITGFQEIALTVLVYDLALAESASSQTSSRSVVFSRSQFRGLGQVGTGARNAMLGLISLVGGIGMLLATTGAVLTLGPVIVVVGGAAAVAYGAYQFSSGVITAMTTMQDALTGNTKTVSVYSDSYDETGQRKADDYPNNLSDAFSVALDADLVATLDYQDDRDCFKLAIPGPGSLVISTYGDADTYGYLMYRDGQVIVEGDNASNNGVNFYLDEVVDKGAYYIVVKGSNSSVGTYGLSVEYSRNADLNVDDDHGDSFRTATEIALNSVPGKFETFADVDFFKFSIPYAGDLTLYTEGAVNTHGSLYTYSSSGTLLKSRGKEGGGNFEMKYAVTPGDYYVEVNRFNRSNSVDAYDLVLDYVRNSGSSLLTHNVLAEFGSGGRIETTLVQVGDGGMASFTLIPDARYAPNTEVGGTCPSGLWNGNSYTTGAVKTNCTTSFSFTALQEYTVSGSLDFWGIHSSSLVDLLTYSGSTVSFTVPTEPTYTIDASVGGTCPAGTWNSNIYTFGPISANCSADFNLSPVLAPDSPAQFIVVSGDGEAELNWLNDINADYYNVYWSTTPGVTKSDNKISNVTAPYTHQGLTNLTDYYYAISAENISGEGPLSTERASKPKSIKVVSMECGQHSGGSVVLWGQRGDGVCEWLHYSMQIIVNPGIWVAVYADGRRGSLPSGTTFQISNPILDVDGSGHVDYYSTSCGAGSLIATLPDGQKPSLPIEVVETNQYGDTILQCNPADVPVDNPTEPPPTTCPNGTGVEVEPNDSRSNAQLIQTCDDLSTIFEISGEVDDSTDGIDYYYFVAPAGVASAYIGQSTQNNESGVALENSAGSTLVYSGNSFGTSWTSSAIPITPGETYFIGVVNQTATSEHVGNTYTVEVAFGL